MLTSFIALNSLDKCINCFLGLKVMLFRHSTTEVLQNKERQDESVQKQLR